MMVRFGRKPSAKVLAAMDAACNALGLNGDWRKSAGAYLVSPGVIGQANVRTRAARAMAEAMSGYGWATSVYYMMD